MCWFSSLFDDPYQLLFRIRESIGWDSPRSRCQGRIRNASNLLGELAVKERTEEAGLGRESLQTIIQGWPVTGQGRGRGSCSYSVSAQFLPWRWGVRSQGYLLEHFLLALQEWASTPTGTLPRHWLGVISGSGTWAEMCLILRLRAGTVS